MPYPYDLTPASALSEKIARLVQEGRQPKQIGSHATSVKYFSLGEADANLNGIDEDKEGEKIWCRHLAAAWLLDIWKTFKKRHYHKSFSKPQNIAFLKDNTFDHLLLHLNADEYHVFLKVDIGKKLAEFAKKLQPGEYTRILFHTHVHCMALTITRYKNGTIRISFYDPNDTKRHTQFLFLLPTHIEELKITDLLTSSNINEYFCDNTEGMFAIYMHNILQNRPASRKFFGTKNISICDKLLYGLAYNHNSWVKQALNEAARKIMDAGDFFKFLKGEIDNINILLFYLPSKNNLELINLYINTVLNCFIPIDKKTELLSPEFFKELLRNDNSATIKLYLYKIIYKSNFDQQTIKTLLFADEEIPKLMINLSDASLKVYIEYILEFNEQPLSECDNILSILKNCPNSELYSAYFYNFVNTGTIENIEKDNTAEIPKATYSIGAVLKAQQHDGLEAGPVEQKASSPFEQTIKNAYSFFQPAVNLIQEKFNTFLANTPCI